MRLATRTLLWSILPFALLLAGSFWAVQTMVLSAVRKDLRATVTETQASVVRMRLKEEERNSRVLNIVAENPALKAGVQLLLDHASNADAKRTMEDQLLEICGKLEFDFMLVSNGDGTPLAAVLREGGEPHALDIGSVQSARQGYFTFANRTYRVASVDINEGVENLGKLSMGEQFDLSGVPVSAVLVHNGKILASNLPGVGTEEIESSLRDCAAQSECDNIRLQGDTYVSLPMESGASENGYVLRSLQNVDAAIRPIQSILRGVFLFTGLGALAGAVLVSVLSSRSIVKPIMGVVAHLRETAKTGELPEFPGSTLQGHGERIHEIRDLTRSFNRASAAIREAHVGLQRANVEFIETLASALDARDPYTAGHSRRVSEYACAIAGAMNLSRSELSEIRIGALLHDIGKIGVSDAILLKPGKLTAEENALIQEHPTIGRRILEGVNAFQPYLAVVELHHENWDGTGYPHGLRGDETPLTARIVKIADAYDAMTSDRPYRKGMSHEKALSVFEEISGSQLDPVVVDAFRNLEVVELKATLSEIGGESLRRLSEALGNSRGPLAPAAFEKAALEKDI
jgi:HD-GYP domain-containing protein (c-di-GMP phosphodiesterase class II)